jgi:ADP-heptose:LPS heptosyltransferase
MPPPVSGPRQRKKGRFASRLAILPRAAANSLATLGRRRPSARPERILIAHSLLLGDTLMLTALLARLRGRYPRAEIVMTVAPAWQSLYSGAPYGVKAVAWDAHSALSFARLRQSLGNKAFDLAIVPGDNRHALLARALGARWIVALAGDRPAWKNRIVDELVPLPKQAVSLADMFALLAGDDLDLVYQPQSWPAPAFAAFAMPPGPYAVLHLGAGSPLRLWGAEKWQALSAQLAERGLHIVWSTGPGEEELLDFVRANDVAGRSDSVFPGSLNLAQLWHVFANARLAVVLDSGVAHLAKHTLTPTVCLFGPGSAELFGAGRFWRDAPFRAVTVDNFYCRDQTTLFKRDISWVRRCERSPGPQKTASRCPAPECMQAIEVAAVGAVAQALLVDTMPAKQQSPLEE